MNNWKETTLEDVCESVKYGYTASASPDKVGPHFLRITEEKAKKLCERTISILEDSLKARNAEEKNSSILAQTYRALVLTAEILKDGHCVKKYLAEWNHQCPSDDNYRTEYDRLRPKFPDYLTPLDDSIELSVASAL